MANYLYNGVSLPALPEHTDFYVYIGTWNGTKHYVYISSAKYQVRNDSSYGYASADGSCICYVCSVGNTTWYLDDSWDMEAGIGATAPPIWANYDILNEDDMLYLAASEPVPVSTFVPDPTSMALGWLIGSRIAGDRRRAAKKPEDSDGREDEFPMVPF